MPAMKTYSLVLSCVSAILVAASASAMSGTSLQQGALFTGDSGKAHDNLFDGGPRALSVGVYLASQKRGMVEDGMTSEWEIRHSIAYLGLDLTPWLTILGGGGQSDLSIAGDNRGADFEWLGAIRGACSTTWPLTPFSAMAHAGSRWTPNSAGSGPSPKVWAGI